MAKQRPDHSEASRLGRADTRKSFQGVASLRAGKKGPETTLGQGHGGAVKAQLPILGKKDTWSSSAIRAEIKGTCTMRRPISSVGATPPRRGVVGPGSTSARRRQTPGTKRSKAGSCRAFTARRDAGANEAIIEESDARGAANGRGDHRVRDAAVDDAHPRSTHSCGRVWAAEGPTSFVNLRGHASGAVGGAGLHGNPRPAVDRRGAIRPWTPGTRPPGR